MRFKLIFAYQAAANVPVKIKDVPNGRIVLTAVSDGPAGAQTAVLAKQLPRSRSVSERLSAFLQLIHHADGHLPIDDIKQQQHGARKETQAG
jgi:hypothetical protein